MFLMASTLLRVVLSYTACNIVGFAADGHRVTFWLVRRPRTWPAIWMVVLPCCKRLVGVHLHSDLGFGAGRVAGDVHQVLYAAAASRPGRRWS